MEKCQDSFRERIVDGHLYRYIIGLIQGKQTKLSLNSKEAVCKFGKLDEELNYFSKLLFLLMVTLSLMLILLRGSYGELG